MVNYYIYAKDFSGSTHGEEFYHTNGLKTLEQFKRDVEEIEKELLTAGKPSESKVIYLHWDSSCSEEDEDEVRQTYIMKTCGGGTTEPATIIKRIRRDYYYEDDEIKLLYIITDGLIPEDSVSKCFELNKYMQYERVVFHAFNENLSEIDMSVAASFFKSHCKAYQNNQLVDNVDISQEYDYDKISVDNFSVEKENLKSYIKLKFIKACKKDAVALQEITKLKTLRNRLFDELPSKVPEKINLETKNKEEFLKEFAKTNWYQTLNALEQDTKFDIDKSISSFINYIISERKSYSFDALKFNTKFDTDIQEEEIDVDFPAEQEIEFPDILLEEDKGIPVVLLTEFNLLDKLIFHRPLQVSPASFRKFKGAMDCPLFLMDDPDIKESIGYFYTLNAYKQLLKTTRKEPRTRRTFHGGLVLTNTNLFDKYNDYILSATYFNSKKVNFNVGLFYFILWKNCEAKQWMDKNVKKRFKKYIMRRISSTVCKIGLSSLPLDPTENVSLPTALWYCIELSSCIFKNDPKNFSHERLRMFYGVAQWIIEILRCLDYKLDLKSIEKRRELMKFVMILKKIPRQSEKVYYLLERIFKKSNGFLVSEIEKPYNLDKLNYLKYNHKGMMSEDVMEEKVDLNKYVRLLHCVGDLNKSKAGKGTYRLCKKTFRPYFTLEGDKSFYTELVKATRKAVIRNSDDKERIEVTYESVNCLEFDRILSLYNLYIKCVKNYKKYPTLPEYTDYVLKKKKYIDNLVTIFPPNVYFDIEDVYSRYQKIVGTVEVREFIKVTDYYYGRSQRIKAEEVVKFNDDDKISEFISREELKVNLNKNSK